MKILYAIQGTGNGHITVAREVIPLLKKRAEVDILVSGTQVDIGLPYDIKYRLHGLCFVFGKKGGIDYLETFRKSRLKQFYREILSLPVEDYDLVLSDFEPVSAWACYLKNRNCIGFSHQAAVCRKGSPRPDKKDPIGMSVLKYYAPVSHSHGFHFLPYDHNIHTPIIRSEIRNQPVTNAGHYTVYLPAFSDKRIVKTLSLVPGVQWEVFSKHSSEAYQFENFHFRPVQNELFIQSMAAAEGILCGAGFQTPSEVLFLQKKLMVIPMKGQYEQQCNGAALKLLGVPVLKNLKRKQAPLIREWVASDARTILHFPDETEYILGEILDEHSQLQQGMEAKAVKNATGFRNLFLKKIFYQ